MADIGEGEGVVGAHDAVLLDEEQLFVDLVGRQIPDASAVERKAIQRRHLKHRMLVRVVLLLDPGGELAVERVERAEIELAHQELVAAGSEKSFDFSLRRAISQRRVRQDAADARGDLHDLARGVDRTVIDVNRLRHAAFVESAGERLDQAVHVFGREELAVHTEPRCVVD